LENNFDRNRSTFLHSIQAPVVYQGNNAQFHDLYLTEDDKHIYVNDYLDIKKESSLSEYKMTVNRILTNEEYREKFGIEKNDDPDLK